MNRLKSALTAVAMMVLSLTSCVTARTQQDFPDLANRDGITVEVGKEYRIGVSGVVGKIEDEHIRVTYVIPDSPAYGKVKKGDIVRAYQYRGVGGSPQAIQATTGKRIFRLGRDWDWHLYLTVERESLRDGKGNRLTFDLIMPRPSDKTYHFGPTGFFGKIHQGFIEVDHVYPGSPSDGKLKVGDQIVAVDNRPVTGDVFKLFASTVDKAESKEGNGALNLTVRRAAEAAPDSSNSEISRQARDDKSPEVGNEEKLSFRAQSRNLTTVPIKLSLQVLGTYSKTTPINCPKTDAIISRTADKLMATGDYGKLGTGLTALLATGDRKCIEHVKRQLHEAKWASPDVELSMANGYVSWPYSQHLIALCEYYLLTKDKFVLPAINAYAKIIARGQDAAGQWNHRMANPDANFGKLHGRLYGYASINQTSVALWVGLILAKECGVKDAEVDMAVEKSYRLYSYWIERGKLPYGNHGAGQDFFTNNGTSGSVALAFALLGDKKGASFFSRQSAAASKELLTGHTGPWFNILWSGLGANVAGPEATKAYANELHWFRTVTRTWDDRFLHMEAWGCGPKSGGLGSSASTLLNLCASRQKLRITGRGMDKSLWLDANSAQRIVDAANIDYAGKSVEELIALLGHELPPVRTRAAEMLAIKDAEVADQVISLLAEGTRNERIGAIRAIGALKIDALEELMAIVRNTRDDLWIREQALRQLRTQDGADKHTAELLAILVADKDWDVQGRFDEELGGVLVTLTDSDPYSAGLDKDLLYKAVNKLLEHKRQNARGAGMSLLKNIPLEDLHIVADKMIYVIEDKDRTYVTYHGDGHRQDGLNILYGHNIDESLDLTVNTINEKVGRGWRARNRKAFMKTWGREAKRVIPRMKEVLGDGADEFIKIIEEAETEKKMISLEEAKKLGKKQ